MPLRDTLEILERWRFGFLLLTVLLALVVEPVLFGPDAGTWIFEVVYSFIFVTAVFAIATHRQSRIWFGALTICALFATWVHRIVPGDPALIAHHLVGICFLFAIVLVTLKGLFSSDEINLDIVLGTLAGYLLLGTAWALIYSLIHLVSPGSFIYAGELGEYVDKSNARFSAFIYYSFVTLTTLGYGDMSPVSQAARTFSWLEAAVGQFYIATLVAGIVGILVSSRANDGRSRMHEIIESARPKKRNKRK